MVDVVQLGAGIFVAQLDEVLQSGNKVSRRQTLLVFVYVQIEFAVDSESTNQTQSITGQILELFLEELLCLFQQLRVAWTQASVDLPQSVFMRFRHVVLNGLDNHHVFGLGHDFQRFNRGIGDSFGNLFGNLLSKVEQDVPSFFARRNDNVVQRVHADQLFCIFDGLRFELYNRISIELFH